MIGVISKDTETEVVKEFFELFKTPWEFYVQERYYDVVICTQNKIPKTNSKLSIIYGFHNDQLQDAKGISIRSRTKTTTATYNNFEILIYGDLITFEGAEHPILFTKNGLEIAGVKIAEQDKQILHIGFNLFQEISYLLSNGQPTENAHLPLLEIHISMLRNWILEAGIPIVEIPAVPAGHNFTVCLTHDVDFIKIGQHKFDHTLIGFIYRALISSLLGLLSGRFPLRKLLKNYRAVLSLPFIYLGLIKDFWFQFDRYIEIEKGVTSTYFIIPFKNRVGEKVSFNNRDRRATRYDIDDIRDVVQKLIHAGFEVGLHGIDAWHSVEFAYQELKRITEITGQSELGVRIHWLCFDECSPKILDKVGFLYDSTMGYNEAIGYRVGSIQIFRPLGVKNLLELPLHIQDVALLSANQSGLSEKQAWEKCNSMFLDASVYGGVLTILWHCRSIAPERLWGDFYISLLSELKKLNVWFATASQAVAWFRMRRSITFESAAFQGNKLYLRLKSGAVAIDPKFIIRIHLPETMRTGSGGNGKRYIDVTWQGAKDIEIPLN